jgi:hypothetical protein
MNDEKIITISLDEQKKYEEAYVYGTYAPMSWLKDELLKVKLKVAGGFCVSIGDGEIPFEIRSIEDFMKWIERKYPDLSHDMK